MHVTWPKSVCQDPLCLLFGNQDFCNVLNVFLSSKLEPGVAFHGKLLSMMVLCSLARGKGCVTTPYNVPGS